MPEILDPNGLQVKPNVRQPIGRPVEQLARPTITLFQGVIVPPSSKQRLTEQRVDRARFACGE